MNILHRSETVDNARYTRQQPRIGGIRSGASRRFKVRDRHARVRQLRREGHSLRAIAREVGYAGSTVCRILSGVIRTCLNRAETIAAKIADGTLLRELTYAYKKIRRETDNPDLDRRKPCPFCHDDYHGPSICPWCGRAEDAHRDSIILEAQLKPWFPLPDGMEAEYV